MDQDQIARALYLGLLVAAILGSMVLSNRQSLGKLAQQASIWGLILVGVAAGYGLWSDIRGTDPRIAIIREDGQIEVPKSPDGHYYITLQINDIPVNFMVDTGASEVVLSQQDARRIGIDPASLRYFGEAFTANGRVRTAQVDLGDVVIAGQDQGAMQAWVNEGDMDVSLLGMRFLRQFARLEFSQDRLLLSR